MDLEMIGSAGFWEDGASLVAGEPEAGMAGFLPPVSVAFKTSGTSGAAKWVTLEKHALLFSARVVNEWLGVKGTAKWGLALPLNHVGGFGVVARAFAAGCGLARFEGKWEPSRFAEWVAGERVSHLSLVPTQVHDLVAAGTAAPKSLRAVVVGGGRLGDGLGQAARDAGWPVLASYGMTEAGSQIATQEMASLKKSFSGGGLKVLPGWDVEATPEGLLRIRGEALFTGTLEQRAGAWLFQKRVGDWFQTNDRVALCGDQLKPLGRADTMVKIMGELVDIEGVETRFLESGGRRIGESFFAIVAVPDERREHSLVAVFEKGNESTAENFEIYQKVAPGIERLSGYFVIDLLPRTELGKIRRSELLQMAAAWLAGNR